MTDFARRFTDAQVKSILLSTDSDGKTGAAYGVSRSTIGQIRTGKTYKEIHPEIQRRLNRSCFRCKNWKNSSCLFEFPDPLQEGPSAANYCSTYLL